MRAGGGTFSFNRRGVNNENPEAAEDVAAAEAEAVSAGRRAGGQAGRRYIAGYGGRPRKRDLLPQL